MEIEVFLHFWEQLDFWDSSSMTSFDFSHKQRQYFSETSGKLFLYHRDQFMHKTNMIFDFRGYWRVFEFWHFFCQWITCSSKTIQNYKIIRTFSIIISPSHVTYPVTCMPLDIATQKGSKWWYIMKSCHGCHVNCRNLAKHWSSFWYCKTWFSPMKTEILYPTE